MKTLKEIKTPSDIVEAIDNPVNMLLLEREATATNKQTKGTLETILKQYKTPTWVAAVKNVFSSSQFYLSAIQFAMVASLAFDGAIGAKLRMIFPWMTFWTYIGIIGFSYLLLMAFEWKVIYPSMYRLTNQQGYAHGSPVRADFEKVMERLDKMEKLIQETNKKNN